MVLCLGVAICAPQPNAEACWFSNRVARRVAYYNPAWTTAYYAPTGYVAASPCATGCAPRSAFYVPSNAYRTAYAAVPVTAYQPVGCNGLQACTTPQYQARRLPVAAFSPAGPHPTQIRSYSCIPGYRASGEAG